MYGVHRMCAETGAVSRGTSHATTKQRCQCTTSVDIQNRARKGYRRSFKMPVPERPPRLCGRTANCLLTYSKSLVLDYLLLQVPTAVFSDSETLFHTVVERASCGVHKLLGTGVVPTSLTLLFWWWLTVSSVFTGRIAGAGYS